MSYSTNCLNLNLNVGIKKTNLKSMEYNKPKDFILTDDARALLSTKHNGMKTVDSIYVSIRSIYFLPKGSTFTYKGITSQVDDDSVLIVFYTKTGGYDDQYVLIQGTNLSTRVGKRAKELEEKENSLNEEIESLEKEDSPNC